MRQIIPWCRDQTELVISRHEHSIQELSQFTGDFVDWLLRYERDRFIAAAGEWSEPIFRDFLCAPLALSAIRDITDFLFRFQELPNFFQRLIVTSIPLIKQFADMNRLLDFVYAVSELQRLESEFPGNLTFKDYEFAHWWWSDWFYRNVSHLRARLEGDELF